MSLKIIVGMFLGVILGLAAGKSAAPFGDLGKYLIQIIKTVATPLLFFTIVTTVIETHVKMKSALKMIMVATFNVSISIVIALTLTNIFNPGKYFDVSLTASVQDLKSSTLETAQKAAKEKVTFSKVMSDLIPDNLITPFEKNSIPTIVLLAIIIGFSVRALPKANALPLENLFSSLMMIVQKILSWVIHLIPVAVFGVVAKSVGEYGFAHAQGLAAYLFVGLLALSTHIIVTYHSWVLIYAKIKFKTFWDAAREPVVYSFGSNSSLATVPLTLQALEKLKISKQASALGVCVGTNFNNDGIVLYEAMAALFIAQAYGVDFTLLQQVGLALTCIVAAMGITGVPEAGIISLAVVLGATGLPLEILPLLLTVDWIIARMRSVTNVLSDMVVSIILDRNGVK